MTVRIIVLLLFFLTSTSRAEWKPQEQLVQPGPVNTKDFYGASVRMSGDYVVVGAHGERSKGRFAGAAYVYKFNPVTASYDHEATLWAADADEKDRFGISVAIYETTVVVGAYLDESQGANSGSAYVYDRNESGEWTQTAKLTASDAGVNQQYGISVDIWDTTLVVGANFHGPASFGAVYVYQHSGSLWQEQKRLKPATLEENNNFGVSVAIHKDLIAVGANGDNSNGRKAGTAYVFSRNGEDWDQTAKLLPWDGSSWDELSSVAVYEGTVLVGAYYHDLSDNGDTNEGAAYIFRNDGTGWAQEAKLTATDESVGAEFGRSVTLGDGVAVIGAPFQEAVYIFNQSVDGSWGRESQMKMISPDPVSGALFGCAVDIDGDKLAVGANLFPRGEPTKPAGAVYIFRDQEEPSQAPTDTPTLAPSIFPSASPTPLASGSPSETPSDIPSVPPTPLASEAPTAVPSKVPSWYPTSLPTHMQSDVPTRAPSSLPSTGPSATPTVAASEFPSVLPSHIPTIPPSSQPSVVASHAPSVEPSMRPSLAPTIKPTIVASTTPTSMPSLKPSEGPSLAPTAVASTNPTIVPSMQPSPRPSSSPTAMASANPTISPSSAPSSIHSSIPTNVESAIPTRSPSGVPTSLPSEVPTLIASEIPTVETSNRPTTRVSEAPTVFSSSTPTSATSSEPTALQSVAPSTTTSGFPTTLPSDPPTMIASQTPTQHMSGTPTVGGSETPSFLSSVQPSSVQTSAPTMFASGSSETPTSLMSQGPVDASDNPTSRPSSSPIKTASETPSVLSSSQPTPIETSVPTIVASVEPSTASSNLPTKDVSQPPTMIASKTPTMRPSPSPIETASESPTLLSSFQSTPMDTSAPTLPASSTNPKVDPSIFPTLDTSQAPATATSENPTTRLSTSPIGISSEAPSGPFTSQPSRDQTSMPTTIMSVEPSTDATNLPISMVSQMPTIFGSEHFTPSPSSSPIETASEAPTVLSSFQPTSMQTWVPTVFASANEATADPSIRPTAVISQAPTNTVSSLVPTFLPSALSSATPTDPRDERTTGSGAPSIGITQTPLPMSVEPTASPTRTADVPKTTTPSTPVILDPTTEPSFALTAVPSVPAGTVKPSAAAPTSFGPENEPPTLSPTLQPSTEYLLRHKYQYLQPRGIASDHFGADVGKSGEYVIIGAPLRGVAYIYRHSPFMDQWFYEETLESASFRFGEAVSIFGGTAVVGSRGGVNVYTRDNQGVWILTAEFATSDVVNPDRIAVDLWEDTAVFGISGPDGGVVFVYSKKSGQWEQQAKIVPDNTGVSGFGRAVSIHEGRIVCGANGSIFIYASSDGPLNWAQEDRIDESSNSFGRSVSIFKDTVLVGSKDAAFAFHKSESRNIYLRNSSLWKQLTSWHYSDDFGAAVALNEEFAVVGSPVSESVYLIARPEKTAFADPRQQKTPSNKGGSHFGISLDLDDTFLLVGAPLQRRGKPAVEAGSAFLYDTAELEQPVTNQGDQNRGASDANSAPTASPVIDSTLKPTEPTKLVRPTASPVIGSTPKPMDSTNSVPPTASPVVVSTPERAETAKAAAPTVNPMDSISEKTLETAKSAPTLSPAVVESTRKASDTTTSAPSTARPVQPSSRAPSEIAKSVPTASPVVVSIPEETSSETTKSSASPTTSPGVEVESSTTGATTSSTSTTTTPNKAFDATAKSTEEKLGPASSAAAPRPMKVWWTSSTGTATISSSVGLLCALLLLS